MNAEYNRRIMIVDDNEEIHRDFRKILLTGKGKPDAEKDDLEKELFGGGSTEKGIRPGFIYELDFALQGTEAYEKVRRSAHHGEPFALLFMDARMPPGLDGIQTIKKIWGDFPYTEMVLCTAYSDYTEDDIIDNLGVSHRLLILKKPFDPVEVRQLALALTTKWNLEDRARRNLAKLERELLEKGKELPASFHDLKETL